MAERPKLRSPRYKFLLNPHVDLRLSRCPTCRKMTYPRKLPLLIDVKGWGLIVQGKTCQYCSRCEMIMCHQVDLETQLALSYAKLASHLIGSDYLTLGTVDLKHFVSQLHGPTGDDSLTHFTPFIPTVSLDYDPGGWRHADAPPRIITAAAATEHLSTPWKSRP